MLHALGEAHYDDAEVHNKQHEILQGEQNSISF